MAEPGEFSFVFHDLMLHSYLFICRSKGPLRREAYNVPFPHISMFSPCSGYRVGRAELSEFCFVSHHLILHSHLFLCRLNGPVTREAYNVPLFHISIFSLYSD